jgi:hypothetical protein
MLLPNPRFSHVSHLAMCTHTIFLIYRFTVSALTDGARVFQGQIIVKNAIQLRAEGAH